MTYSLFQLLVFFDSQSHCNFRAIYDVLSIIDSKVIVDTDKRDLILETLRQAMLLDKEYLNEMPESVKQAILAAYQKKLDDKNNK